MKHKITVCVASVLFFISCVGYQAKAQSNSPKVLRIYAHIIRTSSGLGGQTEENAKEALCILKSDFAPHNIFFEVVSMEYIDDDIVYAAPTNNQQYADAVDGVYGHDDGIDIYFTEPNHPGIAFAGDEGENTFIIIGGLVQYGQESVPSHVITHEMGHVFALYHTHHGYESGVTLGCAELVDGSNCLLCGDFVCDTPADVGVHVTSAGTYDVANCNWVGFLGTVDANGDSYTPNATNYMSYCPPSCMDNFTPGQESRMHSRIINTLHLSNCLMPTGYPIPNPNVADLYIMDGPKDLGSQPSPGVATDAGPDIWYRNQNDGLQYQYNEPLDNSGSYYVYVRVRNRSCVDYVTNSSGVVNLYWSRFGTAQSWSSHWDGSHSGIGGQVSTSMVIPSIPAQESRIIGFPWNMSSTISTSVFSDIQVCLLAKIDGVPMDQGQHVATLYEDVKRENNFSMKNLIIRDADFFKPGGVVAYRFNNPDSQERDYGLHVSVDDLNAGVEDFELWMHLSEADFDNLSNSGQSSGVELIEEGHKVLITGPQAYLEPITLLADSSTTINLSANFLVDHVGLSNDVLVRFDQVIPSSTQSYGSSGLVVQRSQRPWFNANAGIDQLVGKGDTVTITAQQINESAVYNWYNSDGELVHSGASLTISPEFAEEYQLEVLANQDGYKDYDTVCITVLSPEILSVSPNPSSTYTQVDFETYNATSSYIMLIRNLDNVICYNQIIQLGSTSATINTSTLQAGVYTIGLVCDGVLEDATMLLVN